MPSHVLLLPLLLGLTAPPVNSEAARDLRIHPLRETLEIRTDQDWAEDWGLRAEEWLRYRQLQQGPLGLYSPHLDPLTALGIEARSDEERRRYAELQVRAESTRVIKELAYQRAYDLAWKRLYPGLRPVDLLESRNPSSLVLHSQDRLALFVRDNCWACNRQVRKLQAEGVEFDVYMIGSGNDDARLQRWAKQVALDPLRVREGRVTLNHDAGRWSRLGVSGDLPALVREVDGQWQRQ
ncbi:TIGR03759 family integrating conjugative element protein [Pseudomonas asplenii]|uniref:TIGR03759 family integrating conjugative element protein n=1 Tax=Pseudomonas asplenii TaxID=53407 RepID=UPI0037C9A5DD